MRRGTAAFAPARRRHLLARAAPAPPPLLQFFKDIDGAYVANVRLYDPAVVDLAPKVCLWLRREERARPSRLSL